ncbi:hypothetical protein ACFY7V_03330 [[Kitasatospora] papulosa]|uniref:hypothetical protein n=1 Tax=Streptomyces TaxID=1883 RepID=UPI002FEF4A07
MDLGDIATLSAATAAVAASIVVGRWQLRGALSQANNAYRAALDAVTAAADRNHDHWRRSVQRDAYVQFLVATGEVEQVRYPLHEEDIAALRGQQESAQAALDRATSAFYILRLESPDLSQTASDLLAEVQKYTRAQRAWAGYLRAQIVMAAVEEETGTRLTGQRRALERLRLANEAPPSENSEDWHHERVIAFTLARDSLSQVQRLTRQHIQDLTNWTDEGGTHPLVMLNTVKESREQFLNAARRRLDATDG